MFQFSVDFCFLISSLKSHLFESQFLSKLKCEIITFHNLQSPHVLRSFRFALFSFDTFTLEKQIQKMDVKRASTLKTRKLI